MGGGAAILRLLQGAGCTCWGRRRLERFIRDQREGAKLRGHQFARAEAALNLL